MRDVLDFLDEYADGYHHAREDMIFDFICQYHQQTDNLVNQAKKEHLELASLTGALRSSVEQVLLDQPFSTQDFNKRLRRFIDKQSQHLVFEEGRLLPLIDRLMTTADWQRFAEQAPPKLNAHDEATRKERYQQLFNALIEDLG